MSEAQSVDEAAIKKANRKLSLYEKEARFLRKRSEEYQVLEEVFDRPTLLTLHYLMNNGVFEYLNGVVDAGKEARVYWGVKEDGSSIAAKIFLTVAKEFTHRLPYITGDPRFRNARRRGRGLVEDWARKEYANLQTAWNVGVSVPKPITVSRNVLLMEFIGDDGVAAPTLNKIPVGKTDYKRLMTAIRRLYHKAKLVHADLSEFNVFKWRRRLILFDFGSAVDRKHPKADDYLRRDIFNIHHFFAKRAIQVETFEEALRKVMAP